MEIIIVLTKAQNILFFLLLVAMAVVCTYGEKCLTIWMENREARRKEKIKKDAPAQKASEEQTKETKINQ